MIETNKRESGVNSEENGASAFFHWRSEAQWVFQMNRDPFISCK